MSAERWHIADWTGRVLFDGRTFGSFDDGWAHVYRVDPAPDDDEHYYDDYFVQRAESADTVGCVGCADMGHDRCQRESDSWVVGWENGRGWFVIREDGTELSTHDYHRDAIDWLRESDPTVACFYEADGGGCLGEFDPNDGWLNDDDQLPARWTTDAIGCVLDGQRGHYLSADTIRLALNLGMPDPKGEYRSQADTYHATHGEHPDCEWIHDTADNAVEWLTQRIAPTAHQFQYDNGELILTPLDDN